MVQSANAVWNRGNGYGGGGTSTMPMAAFRWQLDQTVNVGRALVAATQRLQSSGIDTPRLDSEVLLAHILGWTRAQLYAHSERTLSDAERARFEEIVEQRYRHEPVAYLVGEKEFYGLALAVDSRVLIPRPETELLVDLALDVVAQAERLSPQSHNGNGRGPSPVANPVLVADIGTGSGAIGVAISANSPATIVYAVDISQDALELARANARRHRLEDRICFCQGDLLKPLPEPVNVIVANLPYIALHEWTSLAPGITNFEPALALAGGVDGLEVIRRLLEQAPARLRPQGTILLEIGSTQGSAVAGLARRFFPDAFVEILSDYGYRDRIVRVQT